METRWETLRSGNLIMRTTVCDVRDTSKSMAPMKQRLRSLRGREHLEDDLEDDLEEYSGCFDTDGSRWFWLWKSRVGGGRVWFESPRHCPLAPTAFYFTRKPIHSSFSASGTLGPAGRHLERTPDPSYPPRQHLAPEPYSQEGGDSNSYQHVTQGHQGSWNQNAPSHQYGPQAPPSAPGSSWTAYGTQVPATQQGGTSQAQSYGSYPHGGVPTLSGHPGGDQTVSPDVPDHQSSLPTFYASTVVSQSPPNYRGGMNVNFIIH
ncbi:hypothetical protein DFH07DRAFT_283706 [Mycena maculata]|uniref:Uncharacterized protein n=1 Tax=Mycena maculata TaxID=230809 RepID=A0AAD7HKS9_9AGAR|nr:hypothetical protein DFH07DRAFT_283706 [Mycena maculata]